MIYKSKFKRDIHIHHTNDFIQDPLYRPYAISVSYVLRHKKGVNCDSDLEPLHI